MGRELSAKDKAFAAEKLKLQRQIRDANARTQAERERADYYVKCYGEIMAENRRLREMIEKLSGMSADEIQKKYNKAEELAELMKFAAGGIRNYF